MRMAVLDDVQAFADLLAAPLILAGHGVISAAVPFDLTQISGFKPEVISLGLFRSEEALDRPIISPEEDIIGLNALKELQSYPALSLVSTVIIGASIKEIDIPIPSFRYDLYLQFPRDLGVYIEMMEKLGRNKRSTRELSNYLCPKCKCRLTNSVKSKHDLFCPKCLVSVAIISVEEGCIYLDEGVNHRCSIIEII